MKRFVGLASLALLSVMAIAACGGNPAAAGEVKIGAISDSGEWSDAPGIADEDDAAVATVNDAPVLVGPIRRMAVSRDARETHSGVDPVAWLRYALVGQVRETAALAEALRQGYEPDAEAIEDFVSGQREMCEEAHDDCDARFADLGMTADEHYEHMRTTMLRENPAEQLRQTVIDEQFPEGASLEQGVAYWTAYQDALVEEAAIEWFYGDLEEHFEAAWPEREGLETEVSAALRTPSAQPSP